LRKTHRKDGGGNLTKQKIEQNRGGSPQGRKELEKLGKKNEAQIPQPGHQAWSSEGLLPMNIEGKNVQSHNLHKTGEGSGHWPQVNMKNRNSSKTQDRLLSSTKIRYLQVDMKENIRASGNPHTTTLKHKNRNFARLKKRGNRGLHPEKYKGKRKMPSAKEKKNSPGRRTLSQKKYNQKSPEQPTRCKMHIYRNKHSRRGQQTEIRLQTNLVKGNADGRRTAGGRGQGPNVYQGGFKADPKRGAHRWTWDTPLTKGEERDNPNNAREHNRRA